MTNKFNAKKTVIDGITFDSKKEAMYYWDLRNKMFLPKAEERVDDIKRQVRYDIDMDGAKICYYLLDFIVTYGDGRVEYVDVKGYKKGAAYQIFKMKKKLVEAKYGIKITEV